jgi:phage tail sheath protein FI
MLGLRGTGQLSRHALTYFPRVRARGDIGRHVAGMPACGVVAGMLARCDRRGVWHDMPPVDTTLKGSLAPVVDIGLKQAATLRRMGANTFVRLQPGIAALQGNVSFAGGAAIEALAQDLSVERLTAFVLRSIEQHTRWVFRAQRTPELAAALERQVWIFLARLKQREALAGSGPEQAFFVRTSAAAAAQDAEHDIAITLRVGFAPRRPNEFLIYDFRYHALSLTTEVVLVREAERHLG